LHDRLASAAWCCCGRSSVAHCDVRAAAARTRMCKDALTLRTRWHAHGPSGNGSMWGTVTCSVSLLTTANRPHLGRLLAVIRQSGASSTSRAGRFPASRFGAEVSGGLALLSPAHLQSHAARPRLRPAVSVLHGPHPRSHARWRCEEGFPSSPAPSGQRLIAGLGHEPRADLRLPGPSAGLEVRMRVRGLYPRPSRPGNGGREFRRGRRATRRAATETASIPRGGIRSGALSRGVPPLYRGEGGASQAGGGSPHQL
jgi:hypothetical protein